MLRLEGVEGSLALTLDVKGTASAPVLELQGKVNGLRPKGSKSQAIDLTYRAWLTRDTGQVMAEAFARNSRVAVLRAAWQGDATRFAASDEASPVSGRARLELDDLPLGAIPGTELMQLRGTLSGHVALDDFGHDAKLTAELEGAPLDLGPIRFDRLRARLQMADRQALAEVGLEQAQGSARASVEARFDWGRRVLPRVSDRVEARLKARDLRLAGLELLLPGTVNELGGRLDADVRGRFGAGAPEVSGQATIRDGVLQEPHLGQRLDKIDADLSLSAGTLRVDKLTARVSSGRLTARAEAKLEGLSLQSAKGELRISEDNKIPVLVEGVAIGDAWGKVDATLRLDDGGTDLAIDVRELTLELPEVATRNVQSLEPAEVVRVGTYLPSREFATIPLQPLPDEPAASEGSPTHVTVKLQRGTRLVRGTELDVELAGQLELELGRETNVSGQIRLTGGELDVRGKLFRVERGVVTFRGNELSNPEIVAAARWDSPSGYVVTVEYVGTARRGELKLTSDPPLPPNEIFSLILFGNPDGMGGGSSEPVAAAVGVAGGPAVKGINRALGTFTDLDVDARVDTSTGSPRPELVLQLTPRLSARLTRALGEPALGQPPDRTFATLDLRLTGRWSVEATVGDRGASALDLIWRHRY
jgi:autotransporter translocation and assembly factor TamB